MASVATSQKVYMATNTCQYTDTEYKFCLVLLAGHEFGEEWSWVSAEEEVGQYIHMKMS